MTFRHGLRPFPRRIEVAHQEARVRETKVGEDATRILEVIHVRLAGPDEPLAELALEALREASGDGAHVYRHGRVESDLLVQFHRHSRAGASGPSELGSRLAALLREHGIVEHSVWIEQATRRE